LSAERFTVRIFGADIAKIKSAKIVGAAEEETIVNLYQLGLVTPAIDPRNFGVD